jgi:hypothetical protein
MYRFVLLLQSVPSTLRSPHRAKQLRRRGLRFERLEARAMLSINADFNGDGFDDLAVGAPCEKVGDIVGAGAVSVIYGGRKGLSAAGNQFWHRNAPGVNGEAKSIGLFGIALAGGDFNGDGFGDLAIGSPTDNVGGKLDARAVNVLYGSATGLRAGSVDRLWTQDSSGVNDAAETAHDSHYMQAGTKCSSLPFLINHGKTSQEIRSASFQLERSSPFSASQCGSRGGQRTIFGRGRHSFSSIAHEVSPPHPLRESVSCTRQTG